MTEPTGSLAHRRRCIRGQVNALAAIQVIEDKPGHARARISVSAMEPGSRDSILKSAQKLLVNRSLVNDPAFMAVNSIALSCTVLAEQAHDAVAGKAASHNFAGKRAGIDVGPALENRYRGASVAQDRLKPDLQIVLFG